MKKKQKSEFVESEELEIFKENLGNHIRKKRLERQAINPEYKIAKLAEDAILDEKHMGRIERGEKQPLSYSLYRISKALNFSVDEIFKEIEEEIKRRKSDKDKGEGSD